LILTGALLLFLLFTMAHFAREWFTTGPTPDIIFENLGQLGFAEQAILLLEDLHIDLVLFSMALLFIGSVLFQTRGSLHLKMRIYLVLSASIVLYIAARFLVPLGMGFAYSVAVLYYGVHLLLAFIFLWLLLDLYRGNT
jgi:hypothetical protein